MRTSHHSKESIIREGQTEIIEVSSQVSLPANPELLSDILEVGEVETKDEEPFSNRENNTHAEEEEEQHTEEEEVSQEEEISVFD